jgi:hypothetical protein
VDRGALRWIGGSCLSVGCQGLGGLDRLAQGGQGDRVPLDLGHEPVPLAGGGVASLGGCGRQLAGGLDVLGRVRSGLGDRGVGALLGRVDALVGRLAGRVHLLARGSLDLDGVGFGCVGAVVGGIDGPPLRSTAACTARGPLPGLGDQRLGGLGGLAHTGVGLDCLQLLADGLLNL